MKQPQCAIIPASFCYSRYHSLVSFIVVRGPKFRRKKIIAEGVGERSFGKQSGALRHVQMLTFTSARRTRA
jgi:hypothetical protein